MMMVACLFLFSLFVYFCLVGLVWCGWIGFWLIGWLVWVLLLLLWLLFCGSGLIDSGRRGKLTNLRTDTKRSLELELEGT